MSKKKETVHLTVDDLRELIKEALGEYFDDTPQDLSIEKNEDYNELISELQQAPLKPLTEGLIKTYGIDKTKEIMMRRFGLNENNFFIKTVEKDGVKRTVPIIILPKSVNKRIVSNIISLMDRCGYTFLRKEYRRNDILMCFEGRFGEDITTLVREKYKVLYHATPMVHLESILQKGLCPRANNQVYQHPERVYLMLGLSSDWLTKSQLETIYNVQASRVPNPENENDYNTYVVLKLAVDRIPDNVVFYADNLDNESIFTYNNIPPSAIITYRQL